jgi:aminotransferase
MNMKISPIASVAEQCRRSGAINLAQGAANFATNAAFAGALELDAVKKMIAYTSPRGLLEFRHKISDYYRTLYSWCPDVDEICVTPGATGAFAAVILSTTQAGDRVLLHEPFWDYHVDLLRVLGREPVIVYDQELRYNRDQALKLIREPRNKIQAVVVVSPGNPSGEIMPKDYIETIIAESRKSKTIVITDEVYSDYNWSGRQSLVYDHKLARDTGRIVLCHSLSKSACLTGWRLGFAIGAAPMITEIARCNGLLTACSAAPLQLAASIGLAKLPEITASFVDIVRQSRERITAAFQSAGFRVCRPDGGFYFLANVRGVGFQSGLQARESLLEKYGIGVVEADGFFGREVIDMIRVCFAVPIETADRVSESLERLC